jgi:hypothetical protein
MSQRNGDRARFPINRRRKLQRRQRVRVLLTALLKLREGQAATSGRGLGSQELRRTSVAPA